MKVRSTMYWKRLRIDWVWALLLFVFAAGAAETQRVDARITYRIPEGVYIDAGKDQGLLQGVRGNLIADDGRTFAFEVLQAAGKTALLQIDGQGSVLFGSAGTLPVQLVFERQEEVQNDAVPMSASDEESAPFVPLLAPQKNVAEIPRTGNISHGNVGLRHAMQTGTDNGLDRMNTRFYTSGDIDRLFGSLWSFTWSGNVRYRTGDAYIDHPEYESLQPLIYSAMFQHPLDQGGFIRFGRFLPYELPAIGYLDGVQFETDPDNLWRFGVAAGVKPDRVDLAPSIDEAEVTGYATLENGMRGRNYYSGTAGLLTSFYKGKADRMALLFDQRADIGPRFNLFSSAEYDFGVADTTNSQAQLSRFDLTASYKVLPKHTLRAGTDHWQRIDSQAERDQFGFVDDQLFDDGYWRYWVGGMHRLPWNLNLNEEIAYTVSDATDDALRWRFGLTRSGVLSWSAASISATVYNLEAMGSSGYGGLLSGYFPFWNSRISIRPSASMRWLESDLGGDKLSVSFYSVYLDARLSKAWLLTGGLNQSLGDGADSTQFDLGVRYSW